MTLLSLAPAQNLYKYGLGPRRRENKNHLSFTLFFRISRKKPHTRRPTNMTTAEESAFEQGVVSMDSSSTVHNSISPEVSCYNGTWTRHGILGGGSFGAVYLEHHTETGNMRAVKQITNFSSDTMREINCMIRVRDVSESIHQAFYLQALIVGFFPPLALFALRQNPVLVETPGRYLHCHGLPQPW